MPLLKREPDLFPKEPFDLPLNGRPWRVPHVKSWQEKVLARHLHPLGIPYYLLQSEPKIRRAGRYLVSLLPLFPGYLFFRCADDDGQTALRSNLVAQVIDVVDQSLLHAELGRLPTLRPGSGRRRHQAWPHPDHQGFLAPLRVRRHPRLRPHLSPQTPRAGPHLSREDRRSHRETQAAQ